MDNPYKYAIGHQGKLHRFSAMSKPVLMADVIRFHQKNNIKFSEAEISASIDRQSKLITSKKRLTITEAIHGARAILKYTTGTSASPEEIVRRSKICANCPLINKVGGCMSCGAAGAIAKLVSTVRAKMRVGIQIPSEVRSHYCGHCGCSLALIVVTPLSGFNFESNEKNGQRPDVCWLKRTSINYKP